MDKRKIGNYGEDMAAKFLTENGLTILERNFSTKHGELDIIARDKAEIVFLEVKYRGEKALYNPLDSITPGKIKRIVAAARVYLYIRHIPEDTPVRFDCIGIEGTSVSWIKNAFEAY